SSFAIGFPLRYDGWARMEKLPKDVPRLRAWDARNIILVMAHLATLSSRGKAIGKTGCCAGLGVVTFRVTVVRPGNPHFLPETFGHVRQVAEATRRPRAEWHPGR